MSFADDAEFDAFFGRDNWLPIITRDAVAHALKGFSLPLLPHRNLDWLAMAVRRSLAISMRNVSDGPERTSNLDIRTELERLAGLARSSWTELFQCDHAADSQLWDHAARHWNGEGATDFGDGLVIGEPSDYRRFKAAVAELDWLASFLSQAATATESQRGPWRQSEIKRLRIERGQYLAPIFEAAFGQPVSANNFPNDARHKSKTAFMEFYESMVKLAFGEREATNLAEVVKLACQRHRQHPVQFSEGVIPGL